MFSQHCSLMYMCIIPSQHHPYTMKGKGTNTIEFVTKCVHFFIGTMGLRDEFGDSVLNTIKELIY